MYIYNTTVTNMWCYHRSECVHVSAPPRVYYIACALRVLAHSLTYAANARAPYIMLSLHHHKSVSHIQMFAQHL